MSRPLQILLVAVLLFGAVWLIALRPQSGGDGSSTPSRTGAQTSPAQGPGGSLPGGLGKSVTKARGAAGQSAAANQRIQQATGGGATSTGAPSTATTPSAATTATGTARAPTTSAPAPAGVRRTAGFGLNPNNAAASSLAVAAGMLVAGVAQAAGVNVAALGAKATTAAQTRTARRPVPAKRRPVVRSQATSSPAAVQAAMAHGKVVVLLFWNKTASDDRAVRSELRQVSNHGGRVLIVAAPIREVSRFSAAIRGVQVLQSPTVVIIDANRKARTLIGYTDHAEIGQAVDQAIAGK